MSWQQFKHAWLIKFWAPIPAVIAAGDCRAGQVDIDV
jgi:hypothetical protein